jgi:hypothetical protein
MARAPQSRRALALGNTARDGRGAYWRRLADLPGSALFVARLARRDRMAR